MTTAATIVSKLVLEDDGFDTGMTKAQKSTNTFHDNFLKKMKSVGATISRIGMQMTMAFTLAIGAAGAYMVDAASDLAESANAVNVVYGEAAEQIQEFGENSAESVGLATSEFNQLAAVTGAFLKNLGLNQAQAAEETIKLTTRASDMASIFNTDVATALAAIQSGLKGEFNPLEQFGVKLNAAAIEAKAMSMGLVEATVDMTKVNGLLLDLEKSQTAYNKALASYGEDSVQARDAAQKLAEVEEALNTAMAGSASEISDTAKAQAALALIYQQTEQFAGDFANTSDGLANSTRILKAQIKDEAATLGQQLLPYVLQGVRYLSQLLEKFRALSPEQQKWILVIAGVIAVAGPLLVVIGSLITAVSALIPVITALASVLTVPLILVILAVIAVIAVLYLAWTNNWGGIREKTAEAIEFISDLIDSGMQFIYDLTHGNLGELSEIWNRTTSAISQLVRLWFSQIKLLFQAFQAAFSGDWRRFGEILRQLWDNAWKGMLIMVKTSWGNIQSFLHGAANSLMSWWNGIDWGALGRNLIQRIAQAIVGAIPTLIAAGTQAFNALKNILSGFFNGGGGGSTPPSLPPGTPIPYAQGSNGWQTVPAGYNSDNYLLGVSSGEEYAVVPRGGQRPGGGSGTVNYFNPQITVITGKPDPKKSLKGFV